jgi:hypothetical protein
MRTPNGILIESNRYPVDAKTVDWVVAQSIEQAAIQYSPRAIWVAETLSQLHIKFVTFLPDKYENGSRTLVTGTMSPSGELNVAVWSFEARRWRDPEQIYCSLAHEMIHWINYQMEHDNSTHSMPFFGANSINDNVCRKINKVL